MPQILIVDDERGIRESLSIILGEQGHEVDTAPGVQEALSLMIRKTYDLVLTDLVMPKIDGLELIKTIRGKWGRQLPVIIITAHGTTDIASLALNEGICDFIIKPFDIKTITEAVRYALDKLGSPTESFEDGGAGQPDVESQNYFEKKFFGLSLLDEIGKTVTITTEIDKIGDILLATVQPMLYPNRSVLAVYSRDLKQMRFQRFRCAEAGENKLTAVDKIILEWVMKSGQPLVIHDVARDARFRACLAGIYTSGSLLAVPILRKSCAFGGLILYRPAGSEPFGVEAQQVLSVLASMASIAFENAELYDELKNYFTGTIRALISTVETKDPAHYGHSARVARYALMIGKQVNLGEMELRRLEYLALLHDIGKIGVPERVLRQKPDLTAEEAEMLRTHVLLGENIVRSIHFLPEGNLVVRAHHERFDGQGYPDGLKSEAIPLFSRIIAVADAFDNMVGMSGHRDLMGQQRALARLQEAAGKEFDPALIKHFLKACQELMRI